MKIYQDAERYMIAVGAVRDGIDCLYCPRDGERLEVEIGTYQSVNKDHPRAELRGVRVGDFKDVHTIGVDCPTCRASAGEISLTGFRVHLRVALERLILLKRRDPSAWIRDAGDGPIKVMLTDGSWLPFDEEDFGELNPAAVAEKIWHQVSAADAEQSGKTE